MEEFNYASSGDLEFDYTCVNKLMEVKEEPKDGFLNEIKNPKTGDTIIKSFIIFIIAVVGIALTIKSIKRQNK